MIEDEVPPSEQEQAQILLERVRQQIAVMRMNQQNRRERKASKPRLRRRDAS